jgi:tRNA dimethylallyltransferase
MTRVAVICGPTAAGKSRLAERLAERVGGAIVSADALQVYTGLDIGTAKPSPSDQARYRYHCVDLYGARDRCTAGTFARAARQAIAGIRATGRLPFLVGGSGFYIDATLGRLESLPASDRAWRQALELAAARRPTGSLHRWLRRLDPRRAEAIEPHDQQRVLRALEVVLRTGRRMPQRSPDAAARPQGYVPIFIGIEWPREELYRRIGERVDRMLRDGWLEEVERLLAQGVRRDDHAMQAIGYRDLCAVVAGERSLEEARDTIARDTRRYAKRQMTYFRRWPVTWLRMSGLTDPGDDAPLQAALTALAS